MTPEIASNPEGVGPGKGEPVKQLAGSTDGGAHIMAMQNSNKSTGFCMLCRKACFGSPEKLERHHEKYSPERCIFLCHQCHHRAHFMPWLLPNIHKEKLLRCRHGDAEFSFFEQTPRRLDLMMRQYVAPGRRPAQVEVRKKARELADRRDV